MAKQQGGLDINLKASGDLSSYQYYFVVMSSTNDQIAVANATSDMQIGVLQNDPAASGREASVRIMGHTKIKTGATLSVGDTVRSNASGQAISTTIGTNTTQYCSGVVAVGADTSELAEIILFGPNVSRAA